MGRRKVQEEKPKEGNELEDGWAKEVPLPVLELIAVSCGNWRDKNCDVDRTICNDDTDMSPLVGQQLWKRECSQLQSRSVSGGGACTQAETDLTTSCTES